MWVAGPLRRRFSNGQAGMLSWIKVFFHLVISHPEFIPARKEGLWHLMGIKLKVVEFNFKTNVFRGMFQFNNSIFMPDFSHLTATADDHFGCSATLALAFPFDLMDISWLSLWRFQAKRSSPGIQHSWYKQMPIYYACLLPTLYGIFLNTENGKSSSIGHCPDVTQWAAKWLPCQVST